MNMKKFVTAINCMDGRVQFPVIDWMKKEYGAEYVDMITEPGPVKILAENTPNSLVESLRKRTEISVNKHGSTCIAVIGHFDCAGNPVGKEIQMEQIKKSLKTIESWGFPVKTIGLWVDENWTAQKVM
jgi:carbonic anhydrase